MPSSDCARGLAPTWSSSAANGRATTRSVPQWTARRVELDAKIASGYHSDGLSKDKIAAELNELGAIRTRGWFIHLPRGVPKIWAVKRINRADKGFVCSKCL